METVTINNPTWGDVREGDLITCEYGSFGEEGYKSRVERATTDTELHAASLAVDFLESEWRVTKIVREVPDPLPDHEGAEVFTDRGMARSDGATDRRWDFADDAGHYYKASDLPNPVEALPTPAKELRELLKKTADVNLDPIVVRNAALSLLQATRDEWKRAGIEESI